MQAFLRAFFGWRSSTDDDEFGKNGRDPADEYVHTVCVLTRSLINRLSDRSDSSWVARLGRGLERTIRAFSNALPPSGGAREGHMGHLASALNGISDGDAKLARIEEAVDMVLKGNATRSRAYARNQ